MVFIKVHLVFDAEAGDVHTAVQALAKVTGWDHNLDTCAQWAVSGQGEVPDIIFISGNVNVSVIDPKSGKRLSRHQAMVRKLKEIRLHRPQSRVVLVMPLQERGEGRFIGDLVALGIYDVHFVAQFNEDDIREWFAHIQSFADMREFLPGEDNTGAYRGSPEPEKEDHMDYVARKEDEDERDPGWRVLLEGWKGRLERWNRGQAREVPLEDKGQNKNDNDMEVELETTREAPGSFSASDPRTGKQEAKAECRTIYALNLALSLETAVSFNNWEQMLLAARTVKPDAILLAGDLTDLENRIKYLRRDLNLVDVPIAVIGEADEAAALRAGADECFRQWDEQALERLKERKQRLAAIFEIASSEASRDPLTGLYNRSFLDGFLAEQERGYQKNGSPFSLLFCDLDHFKKVNDSHGHQAGDEVLRKFAAYLREQMRSVDLIARYGGEEFIAVFPRTDREAAGSIARQLRRGWQEASVYDTTFSGGVAEYGRDGQSLPEVIMAADQALYRAKQGGRNAVCLAGETPAGVPVLQVTPVSPMATRVFVVAGAAPRVGATSFTLALAGTLAQQYQVEILDAGGGAGAWLKGKARISIREAPPFSVCPGVVTVVDAGTEVPAEVLPLAEAVFLVSDLSRNAINLQRFQGQGRKIFLVGARGAPWGGLKEIAALWDMEALWSLPEDSEVREAELQGKIIVPKSWSKQLNKLF